MRVQTALVLGVAVLLTACGRGPAPTATAEQSASLLLAAEDLIVVNAGQMASGPVISGSLQPTIKADLRAEVSAVVMQVMKDNGDRVRRGDVLVRLDDTAIRDSLNSAKEAERAATQAFEQAQRQFDRLKTLSGSGAVSHQSLEDAEVRRNSSQSELAAARTRVAQAQQQLSRTEVRAPFDGVVSDRAANAGDTAQIGKQLLMVIDPASMRFEGFVSTEQIALVKVGNQVNFRVNGYPSEEFGGKVQRINPMASANTRQVEVQVQIDKTPINLVAGLFAEGRIKTQFRETLLLPETALVREGDNTFVWRLADKKLAKTSIQIGARDVRRGEYEIIGGIAAGESVIRFPQGALKDGVAVELSNASLANGGQ